MRRTPLSALRAVALLAVLIGALLQVMTAEAIREGLLGGAMDGPAAADAVVRSLVTAAVIASGALVRWWR